KDPNAAGNQRKNLVQAVEASLRRLQTEYIDLYWLHIWDGLTPVEEVMRGLDDLVRQGKVLYVGISDAPAWWIAQANTIAQLRGCAGDSDSRGAEVVAVAGQLGEFGVEAVGGAGEEVG